METRENQDEKIKIIFPPPEIRNIIDRTVHFTARNGPHFEERIRENEKRNVKFCFLNKSDPYHAYYQAKVDEIRNGKVSEIVQQLRQNEEASRKKFMQEESVKPPLPFEFEVEIPTISAKDLEIIKLTAQFTARCGMSFASTILNHSQHNHQFDFLRPNHSLYRLFMVLTEKYSKIITPRRHIIDKINKAIGGKHDILESLMGRIKYQQYKENQHIELTAEVDKERLAYASVNWHDFVVIGTIEFVETDENLDLALPLNLEDLKIMSITDRKASLIFDTDLNTVNEQEEADIELDEGSDTENQ